VRVHKRWPRKREMLSYYILYRLARSRGQETISYGEAVDALRAIFGSKKVADTVVRSLVKQRFLERLRPLLYRIRSPDEVLSEAAVGYIVSRLRKRGLEAHISPEGCLAGEIPEDARRVLAALGARVCGREDVGYSSSS
jgi:hypothetical protein